MNTAFGMSFDTSGNLNSIQASFGSSGVFYSLNPATGSTVSSNNLSGGLSIYSQLGGGLAYSGDGNYYFADSPAGGLQPDGRLVRIQSDATATVIGSFAGTGYDKTKWQSLFSSGPNTYLLNSSNLYLVDLSDASLDLLGNISGLPVEFSSGFSGAVGTPDAPAVVPEPGTWAAAALLAGGAAFMRWRKRAKVS